MAVKPSGRGYAGIPHIVMESDSFKNLSGNAVKLILALSYQYRGKNNGDLTTAWTVMQDKFGFKSQDTIHRAKQQLLDVGLIIQTRTPKFLNPGGQCALYALTWRPIDECPGKRLEMKSTVTPPRIFSMENRK